MPFISASVISPYNSIRGGAEGGLVPVSLLLDLYPGAAAAYSLRKLRTAYTGFAIEVRKTVDTVTSIQDIGFVDNELDTASLLTFAEGGDVFVAKWYDQSGNGGNDAAQVSQSAQPQIVSSGAVITENGEPSVKFNGTTDYIENQLSVGPTVTAFAVSRIVDEFDFNFIYDSFGTGGRIRLGLRNVKEYFADNGESSFAEATTPSDGNQHLFFAKHTNSDVSISVNQDTLQTIASTNFSQTTQHWNIGARNDGADHFLDGTIQELILYPSDQSANRAGIESNINSNYNIYWDGSQTGLLDDYPNASAAYSLRALNSAYTGPAIEARRSSDDDVQDIGFLYDGSLDTESLLTFADGGDVFVAKWYDQSGGGYDSLQPFAAQQPQIVDLGSVVTLNGKPTILSSVGKAMYTDSNSVPVVGDLGERSSFSVLNSNASGLQVAISYVDGGTNLFFPIAFNNGIAFSRNNDPASNATAPYTANSDVVFTSLLNSTNSEVFLNGVSGGGVTGFIPQTGTSKINVFARYANVWSLVGQVSEIILYPSDQTANRVEIETNINNHYTIYP